MQIFQAFIVNSETMGERIYLQVVESACQNGRLLNCSVWGGASREAVEGPQPDRCLHRLDDPGRGAFLSSFPLWCGVRVQRS